MNNLPTLNISADLWASMPLGVLIFGSLFLLLLHLAAPSGKGQTFVFFCSILGAGVALIWAQGSPLVGGAYTTNKLLYGGLMYGDPFSYFISAFLILGTLLAALLMVDTLKKQNIESPSEFYSLLLMSLIGALVFACAADLLVLFLGLEIMSMALYCLCGSNISSRFSAESALKYFLLGSFSSAFLLYGIALLYGATGSMSIPFIASRLQSLDLTLLGLSIGLMSIGLFFKLGVVPFHFWVPDVYQGAPTSITAYMACVVKTSAVAVALRIFWGGFSDAQPIWSGFVWSIALLTMVWANLVAVRQRNVKRMLAYSSIAHAGYLMMAFLLPPEVFGEYGGGTAILFYLVGYTLMTIGSFAVVLVVGGDESADPAANDLSKFQGLGYRNPGLALAMSLFMLTLAGIPPGMIGLVGKFFIFSAAVKGGFVGLTIVAALCSAISCYYYLRVIVTMYFQDKEGKDPVYVGKYISGAVLLCSALILILGTFPQTIYEKAAIVVMSLGGY